MEAQSPTCVRMRGSSVRAMWLLVCVVALAGCGASASGELGAGAKRPSSLPETETKGSGGERCDSTLPDRESSEYDTSGDQMPDVRKVYLAIGTGMEARLVMICRETDLNADGVKDVIRYYDDDGRSLREEADRNFDGKMDLSMQFQDGQVVRKDLDNNADGKVDLKVFFDRGVALRSERDVTGRSTPEQWRPDRWEYFEEGRLVRMGTDLDGDSKVDRWDRDATFKRPAAADLALGEGAEGSAAAAGAATADAGAATGGPGVTGAKSLKVGSAPSAAGVAAGAP